MGASCDSPKKILAEKVKDAHEAYSAYSRKIDKVWDKVEDNLDGTDGFGLREKMHRKKMDLPEGTDYIHYRDEQFKTEVKTCVEKHRAMAIKEAHKHHGHQDHGVGTSSSCRRGSIGAIPHDEVAFLGHRVHIAVTGKVADAPEEKFELKESAIHGLGNIDDLIEEHLAGFRSIKGYSPIIARQNQDDYFYAATADMYRIMGVLDGHGENGHLAAALVRDSMMRTLVAEIPFERSSDPEEYQHQMAHALQDAFKAAQEMLVHQHEVDVRLSGVTACIVIHDVKFAHLHYAWAGNTRAVIADLAEDVVKPGEVRKGPAKRNLVAAPLTSDHTTKNDMEKDRVVKAGAELISGKFDDEINIPGERFPALPVTRCIGNKVAHCIGVTHEPSVANRPIEGDGKEGRFIVIGTDGLWDAVRNSEAIVTIHELRKGNLEHGLEVLESKAKEKWAVRALKQGQVIDDITMGLLYLHGFEVKKEEDLAG